MTSTGANPVSWLQALRPAFAAGRGLQPRARQL